MIAHARTLPVALVLLAMAQACLADSITFHGTSYDGVYVRESVAMYYVEIPSDGTVISVFKEDVQKENIQLCPDRKERAKLHKTWQANYKKKRGHSSDLRSNRKDDEPFERVRGTDTARAIGSAKLAKAGVEKGPVPFLTRSGVEYRTLRTNRPVFVDKNGVGVLTNLPSKYQNDESYTEITLEYDKIEVPKEYRKPESRKAYASSDVIEIVRHYAWGYGLDEHLVLAVIRAESNFNRSAVSRAGARGLMQLMPGTAIEMGVSDIFDPAENIAGGTQYLAKMLGLFGNDVRLALAAYNAGPGAVKKHGGIPPYEETTAYVRRVLEYRTAFAGGNELPIHLAEARQVDNSFLPETQGRFYAIRFQNGLTQRAEEVFDEGHFYLAKCDNRLTRIPKASVEKIIAPV